MVSRENYTGRYRIGAEPDQASKVNRGWFKASGVDAGVGVGVGSTSLKILLISEADRNERITVNLVSAAIGDRPLVLCTPAVVSRSSWPIVYSPMVMSTPLERLCILAVARDGAEGEGDGPVVS